MTPIQPVLEVSGWGKLGRFWGGVPTPAKRFPPILFFLSGSNRPPGSRPRTGPEGKVVGNRTPLGFPHPPPPHGKKLTEALCQTSGLGRRMPPCPFGAGPPGPERGPPSRGRKKSVRRFPCSIPGPGPRWPSRTRAGGN